MAVALLRSDRRQRPAVIMRLLALVLLGVLLGPPRADADVRILERAGPTCDAQVKVCSLAVQISGEITDETAKQLQQLVDTFRRRAERPSIFSLSCLQSSTAVADPSMPPWRLGEFFERRTPARS
jgi:hypothetical protein